MGFAWIKKEHENSDAKRQKQQNYLIVEEGFHSSFNDECDLYLPQRWTAKGDSLKKMWFQTNLIFLIQKSDALMQSANKQTKPNIQKQKQPKTFK